MSCRTPWLNRLWVRSGAVSVKVRCAGLNVKGRGVGGALSSLLYRPLYGLSVVPKIVVERTQMVTSTLRFF